MSYWGGPQAVARAAAQEAQGRIIGLLVAHGAHPTDPDAKGRTVEAAATSEWVRQLLHDSGTGVSPEQRPVGAGLYSAERARAREQRP